ECQALNIAYQRQSRDVVNRVVDAGHIGVPRQPCFVEIEQLENLRAITARAVIVAGPGEFAEVYVLAAHRADIGNLQDQPLQRVISRDWIMRNELAGFLSEIEKDRTGFDYGVGRSTGA